MNYKISIRMVQIILGIVGCMVYFLVEDKAIELMGILILVFANNLTFELDKRIK